MADRIVLQLEPRAITGKHVRTLRRAGIVPGNLYGRGIASTAVQTPLVELRRVFRAVDRNAVVPAQIQGEAETRPIVLRDVKRHPVTREVLHVDLYQVDLTRLIHSSVAIVLTGEAPAVALGGVLVQNLDHITLEALPMEMPSEILVDVSGLAEFGAAITVSDLVLPAGARVLVDETAQIVSVLAPRLAEGEAESEVGVAPAEGAEGAEPSEESDE